VGQIAKDIISAWEW